MLWRISFLLNAGERISLTLDRVPFSAVLWGHLAEVCFDNSGILPGVEEPLVGCNTKVLLPFSSEACLKTDGGLTLVEFLSGSCEGKRSQEGDDESRVMHFDNQRS